MNDDVKARAMEVAASAIVQSSRLAPTPLARQVVAELAAAGLLAAPSHLDRLAAWAAADPNRYFRVVMNVANRVQVGAGRWDDLCDIDEIDLDVQEAAPRVLARLEATDE